METKQQQPKVIAIGEGVVNVVFRTFDEFLAWCPESDRAQFSRHLIEFIDGSLALAVSL